MLIKIRLLRAALFSLVFVVHLQLSAECEQVRYPVIPKPVCLIPAPGLFTIGNSLTIWLEPYTTETQELASFISDAFINTSVQIKDAAEQSQDENGLYIVIQQKSAIEPEGYDLSITPEAITIQTATIKGAFWGFQTVRQLIQKESRTVPCVSIHDYPRFAYRGLHLDVSRHMFPVAFIKKYIDVMASYKLNRFHWHLTDDQGWRIEIKKHPKLQEISAFRKETLIGHLKSLPKVFDNTPYGGFYTQEEIRQVVEYARKRHITIIPEIELPGHSVAVLAAYPELGCTGGPYEVGTGWGIFHDIFCAGNENTFKFLEDVLEEVMELFPGSYIHIGGDEAPKTRWKECLRCQERIQVEHLKSEEELQSYFVRRIEKFVNSKGRHIIGWDEILEGGLAPNATVMSWTGIKGGIEAARLHHKAIMTPYKHLYLDFYQSQSSTEPLAIGGYTPLKKVYQYEPVPEELTQEESQWIYGVQANVWTEYMKTERHVEYMTYPRAIALAETAWTQASDKNFDDFILRLKCNLPQLRAADVQYADHALEE